jgi:hypothetical protein
MRIQNNSRGGVLLEFLLAVPLLFFVILSASTLHQHLQRRFDEIIDLRNQSIKNSHARTKALAHIFGNGHGNSTSSPTMVGTIKP